MTQNQRQANAGVEGTVNAFFVICAEELAQQHRCAAAYTDKKAVEQTDEGSSRADSGQCPSAHKSADDDGIRSVIHLLEECTQQDGEEKGQKLFPDYAFGDFLRRKPGRHRLTLPW